LFVLGEEEQAVTGFEPGASLRHEDMGMAADAGSSASPPKDMVPKHSSET